MAARSVRAAPGRGQQRRPTPPPPYDAIAQARMSKKSTLETPMSFGGSDDKVAW